jgi:hypothetical protein
VFGRILIASHTWAYNFWRNVEMKIKNTIMILFASFAFVAAAYAASPDTVVETQDTVVAQAEANLEAPALGVYDEEALVCMDAVPEIENGVQEVRCWKCSGSSGGSCGGGDKHCYGERSDCTKKGCKITGSTSKCSSSKKTC